MKRLFLAAFLLLVAPARAPAFVLGSTEVNGPLQHPRWAAGSLPVRFKVNDHSLSLLASVADAPQPLAAIQGAMQAWALGPVGISYDGPTSAAALAPDGVNVISLANIPANRDVASQVWATTLVWSHRVGDQEQIAETDIALNPTQRFATDGAPNAGDLQGILTHEFGHALGMDHSAIAAATMFPAGDVGQTSLRNLEADDLAGLRVLYSLGADSSTGSIDGQVLTTTGTPVFGAHVVATDAGGVVRVAGLSDRDGSFTIPSLPAGSYQLCVEPLDGPMTPDDLPDDYFHASGHPILTAFQTAFAGGGPGSAATISVAAGQTTTVPAIHVNPKSPTLNPFDFGWSPDLQVIHGAVAPIHPGGALYLIVLGPAVDTVAPHSFAMSSTDISIDTTNLQQGLLQDGTPAAIVPLLASRNARPGPHTLYLSLNAERAALTGCVEVLSP